MKNVLPKVTFVVFTFNEERNIGSCLKSIFMQRYPAKKIEVLVVDDSSTDKTLSIARKYPVRIISHHSRDGEVGKMIGFREAKGDLFYYMDADVELKGTNWLQQMVIPLIENPSVVGVFTRKYAKKDSPAIERYLAMDSLNRDPVYEMFSPSAESTITSSHGGYYLCTFNLDRIPPAGRCLYRISVLKPLLKGYTRFLELDILKILTSRGHNVFGYVPKAGIYHHHVRSLVELVNKRSRNVKNVYLKDNTTRLYRWFYLNNPLDICKILILILYAHSVFLPFLRGVYKAVVYRDVAGLLEPIVVVLALDTIILSFLLNGEGHEFIRASITKKGII